MTALRLSELAEAAGGTLVRGRPETVVDSFEIDTRRIAARGAFFALKGSRTDGHEFLEEARRRGAAAAVVEHVPEEVPAPDALIRVDDTTAALGRCGAWVQSESGCCYQGSMPWRARMRCRWPA